MSELLAELLATLAALIAGAIIGMTTATVPQPPANAPAPYAPPPVATTPAQPATQPPATTVEPYGNDKPIEPCQHEDSHDCYWLADTMGNGTGTSTWRPPADQSHHAPNGIQCTTIDQCQTLANQWNHGALIPSP